MKEIVKKNLMLIIKIVIIIFSLLVAYFIGLYIRNKTPTFRISEMYITSNAKGTYIDDNNSSNWNLSLDQDNEIYINIDLKGNIVGFRKEKLELKKVYVENFKILKKPLTGENLKIYTISNDEMSRFKYEKDYEVEGKIDYEVVDNNANVYMRQINENGGQLVFTSVNKEMLQYIYNNENNLAFDGTLLKKAGLTGQDIEYMISFDIVIITKDELKSIATVLLELPCGNILENGFEFSNITNEFKFIYVD